MRNIIPCAKPDDAVFRRRLARRLRRVVTPIEVRKKTDHREKERVRTFSGLSESEQVTQLHAALVQGLSAASTFQGIADR